MLSNKIINYSLLLIILPVVYSGLEIKETIKSTNFLIPSEQSNQVKASSGTKGINKATVDSGSIKDIRFKKELSYGSTKDAIVGQIVTIAVDDSNWVYIADGDQTTIHVFKTDGSYHASIGRKGKGPGEFTAMYQRSSFMRLHSNKLYVPDFMEGNVSFPHRVHVFSLDDLSFSHTMKLLAENRNSFEKLKGYYPKRIYPRSDGRFLVAYHRSPHEYKDAESVIRYMVQDSTGHIVSGPILEQKDLTYLVYEVRKALIPYFAMHSFPFFGKSLLAVSEDDHLYTANNTEAFKIDVYNPNGEHMRTFQHPFKNRVFNKSKVIDRYKETDYMARLGDGVALNMIREAQNLPETWPAVETMFFDDEDRLWVSTVVDNVDIYEWWILKKSGKVITKFEWQRDEPIEVVKNGKMYTRKTDEETGLQKIVRYQIEMN